MSRGAWGRPRRVQPKAQLRHRRQHRHHRHRRLQRPPVSARSIAITVRLAGRQPVRRRSNRMSYGRLRRRQPRHRHRPELRRRNSGRCSRPQDNNHRNARNIAAAGVTTAEGPATAAAPGATTSAAATGTSVAATAAPGAAAAWTTAAAAARATSAGAATTATARAAAAGTASKEAATTAWRKAGREKVADYENDTGGHMAARLPLFACR